MKSVSQMRNQAFTLVEIMIVVAVIGLLTVLAIPAFAKARRSSIIQKCILNQRTVFDSVVRYEMDNNTTLFSVRNSGVQIRDLFLQRGYMDPINNFDCPASPIKDYDDYTLIYTNGTDFQTVHCTIDPTHILP
jgi:prepilin-type N-terminal cleavage/methylation domain-containing protein